MTLGKKDIEKKVGTIKLSFCQVVIRGTETGHYKRLGTIIPFSI